MMSDDLRDNELAAADEQIRLSEAKLKDALLSLCASGSVIMERLHEHVRVMKDVAGVLSAIDMPWSRACEQRLREGVFDSEIKRQDREGKILLNLPKHTEEAIGEWLHEMRLGESNPDWLVAANRYGLDRLRALSSIANEVATELSSIDNPPDAQVCAARLRGLWMTKRDER